MSCAGDFLCSDQAMHLHQKLPVDATGFLGGHKCSIALSAGVFFFIAREVLRIKKNWYVFMLFGVYAAIIFHWSVSIPILDPSNI